MKQTAVEWLIQALDESNIVDLNWIDSDRYYAIIEQAKEMEKKQIKSSQTEISDEEIEEATKNIWSDYVFDEGDLYYTIFKGGWEYGIKWYREQLKKKQCTS